MESITGIEIVYCLVGIAISFWIFSEIIRAATKTNRKILLEEIQVKLLASIAFKLGVEKEKIEKDTQGFYIETIDLFPNKTD